MMAVVQQMTRSTTSPSQWRMLKVTLRTPICTPLQEKMALVPLHSTISVSIEPTTSTSTHTINDTTTEVITSTETATKVMTSTEVSISTETTTALQ